MPLKDNAFILYIRNRMRNEEGSTGQKLALPDAINKFGGNWGNLSAEDRKPFEAQAKKNKPKTASTTSSPSPFPVSNRLSCPFTNLAAVRNRPNNVDFARFKTDTPDKIKETFQNWMERNSDGIGSNPLFGEDDDYNTLRYWQRYQIHRLCSPLHGDPRNHRFVLIEASLYARTVDGNTFIPGELGLSVFSFQEGLIDNFSAFIDPGLPPLGNANTFMQSRIEFALPAPPYDAECANYGKIWDALERFIESYPTHGTDTTYLFCREKETRKITGALVWLAEKAGGRKIPWDFCPLGILMFEMSVFARRSYVNWLRRQAAMQVIEKLQRRFPLGLTLLQPTPVRPQDSESDSDSTGTLIQLNNVGCGEPLYPPVFLVPPLSVNDADDSDSDSDDEPVRRDGATVRKVSNGRTRRSNTSCTPTESHMSISEVGRVLGISRPRDECRVDEDVAICLSKRIKELTGEVVEKSLFETANASAPAGMPESLGEHGGNFRKALFQFELQGDAFFESLDLASSAELGCPHHMVNTEGLMQCPLNIVNRNVFNALDALLALLHVHSIEGRHYPSNDASDERPYMTQDEYDRIVLGDTDSSRSSSALPCSEDSESDCDSQCSELGEVFAFIPHNHRHDCD